MFEIKIGKKTHDLFSYKGVLLSMGIFSGLALMSNNSSCSGDTTQQAQAEPIEPQPLKAPIYGTVLEERYQPFEDKGRYTIKVQLDQTGQVIALNVSDSAFNTKESLDMLIQEGSRISLTAHLRTYEGSETNYFKRMSKIYPDTQTSSRNVNDITVLAE
jgi:hypothetical protein